MNSTKEDLGDVLHNEDDFGRDGVFHSDFISSSLDRFSKQIPTRTLLTSMPIKTCRLMMGR